MTTELINGEEWEVFEHYHKRNTNNPLVSIESNGNIHLNIAAYEALGEPTHVSLSYNRGQRIIAIESKAPEQKPNTRVRIAGSNRIIAGRAFVHYYDIDISETHRYKATMSNGIILVDLKTSTVQ